jgi:hypothetical protein
VVTIGVELLPAVPACLGWEGDGESELALEEHLEDLVGEAVAGEAEVVGAEGQAGGVCEEGLEDGLCVGRCRV